MVRQPDWTAPNALLYKIVWSDVLQFRDKLRCRQVCKEWKSLLQQRPSGYERTGSSHDIRTNFLSEQRAARGTTLRLDEGSPTISMVSEANGVLPLKWRTINAARCRWLMPHAHFIRKIQLSGEGMSLWQLQGVLMALQVAPLQSLPAIDVKTPSGSALMISSSSYTSHGFKQECYLHVCMFDSLFKRLCFGCCTF